MEYAIIISLLIYGIVKYDFQGKEDKKNIFFKMMYILMVLMSGLAYRVGADLVGYEISYYLDFKQSTDVIIHNLFSISRAQAGWVLISTILYKSGASFTIFKLIQAAFFQFSIFYIVKKYASYRYITLLLFFIFVFPHVNFNVLRESFAIGFFLFSVPHILNRNWFMYYLYVFCAFLFHNGAFLLVFFPLFLYLDFNSNKHVFITSSAAFILSLLAANSNMTELLMDITYSTKNSEIIEMSEYYFLRDRYTLTGITNVSKSLLFFLINITPLYYVAKKGNKVQKKMIPLAFLFIIVSLINNFVPIAYRYKDYTYVLYFLVLATFLVDYSKKYLLKHSRFFIVLLFGLYFYPIRSYFAVNEYYEAPAWVQYYPYYSIIDKGKSDIRESIFYNKR